MTAQQIMEMIWNLPWYDVLKIAIYDDFILLYKLWFVWLIIILTGTYVIIIKQGKG